MSMRSEVVVVVSSQHNGHVVGGLDESDVVQVLLRGGWTRTERAADEGWGYEVKVAQHDIEEAAEEYYG